MLHPSPSWTRAADMQAACAWQGRPASALAVWGAASQLCSFHAGLLLIRDSSILSAGGLGRSSEGTTGFQGKFSTVQMC